MLILQLRKAPKLSCNAGGRHPVDLEEDLVVLERAISLTSTVWWPYPCRFPFPCRSRFLSVGIGFVPFAAGAGCATILRCGSRAFVLYTRCEFHAASPSRVARGHSTASSIDSGFEKRVPGRQAGPGRPRPDLGQIRHAAACRGSRRPLRNAAADEPLACGVSREHRVIAEIVDVSRDTLRAAKYVIHRLRCEIFGSSAPAISKRSET